MPRPKRSKKKVLTSLLVGAAVGVAALAGGAATVSAETESAVASAATGAGSGVDPITPKQLKDVETWGPRVTGAVVNQYNVEWETSKAQPHRHFHAKTHFGVRATLHGKAAGEKAGMFQAGKSFPAVIRFSSGDPKIQKDSVPDLRGLAIKADASGHDLGPRNELPGGDDKGDEHSQDWIGATGESHFFSRAIDEARIVTASSFKDADAKEGRSTLGAMLGLAEAFARGVNIEFSAKHRSWFNWFGASVPLVENLDEAKRDGGKPNFFQVPAFHSQTPYEFEGKLIRYEYVPFVEGPDAEHPPRLQSSSEHLRSFVDSQLYAVRSRTLSTLWGKQPEGHEVKRAGMRVYARYPPAGIDVNNPQLKWPNAERKHIGTIEFDLSEPGPLPDSFVESLSFNPWRGFVAHRPLGDINRIRRDLYKTASHARVRGKYSCPFSETGRHVRGVSPYTGGGPKPKHAATDAAKKMFDFKPNAPKTVPLDEKVEVTADTTSGRSTRVAP